MNNTPIIFKFERRTILPVITVTGVADSLPGMDRFLMYKAVEFIDLALGYKGVPMIIYENEDMTVVLKKQTTAIRFNIIFKNEDDFIKGVEGLRRELG